jgi:hypothetical protein
MQYNRKEEKNEKGILQGFCMGRGDIVVSD